MATIKPDPLNPNRIQISHQDGPLPDSLPEESAQCCEQIDQHFGRYLTMSDMVLHEIISNYVHLDLLISTATPLEPFHTIITSGMSDRPMTANDQEELYMELLIRLPAWWKLPGMYDVDAADSDDWYWPLLMLKLLARYPHEYGTFLDIGHTIALGEPGQPHLPGSPFTAAVISPSITLPRDLDTLQISPGKTIKFAAIYPSFIEETAYARMQGTPALMDLLIANGVTDVIDPKRQPVVGTPSKPSLMQKFRKLFGK